MLFNCDRTCTFLNECKFHPVLSAIGTTRVYSHTTRVNVQYTNAEALKAAVLALNWQWLGQGTHQLYSEDVTGWGFKIPNWRYPCIARNDGIAMDTYNGAWGQEDQLQSLQREYVIQAVKIAAANQGWYAEAGSDGNLVISHPSGGTLTVDVSGSVEAHNFTGGGCKEAVDIIAAAIGGTVESTVKPETTQQLAQQSVVE